MITLQVKHLTTLKEKSIGLIGTKNIIPVYFQTRWGIHTFGVLSPIDIIILDANNTVVKLADNLKPNRIFIWHPKHYHVVELPSGEIKKKQITVGDKITLM
jgi:uncharacterized membrane protein (UPF0127 family)